jgi:putative transposase
MNSIERNIGNGGEHVPFYRFGRHDRITINGVVYAYGGESPTGHFFRRLDDLELVENFSHETVYSLNGSDGFAVEKDWFKGSDAVIRAKHGTQLITDLVEKASDVVLWRHSLIYDFYRLEAEGKFSRSDASLDRYMQLREAEIRKENTRALGRKPRGGNERTAPVGVTPRTFRRWLKRFEESGFDPRSLQDAYRFPGTRPSKFTAEESEIHRKWAAKYASLEQPSKSTLFEGLNAEIDDANEKRALEARESLKAPSRRTFECMIDALDELFVLAGRKGAAYAARKLQITQGGLDVERPLQRVEMDEWLVDLSLILMDIGIWEQLTKDQKDEVARTRVWLSIAMDAATRSILAMRFIDKAPSAESSVATLEMAVHDKTDIAGAVGTLSPWEMHGTPESIYTDAGAAYVSNLFKTTAIALTGIAVVPPSGNPHLRGTVERMFLTIRQRFLSFFSGQTFANVVVRGDYDSEATSSIDVEELNRLLVRGIVDCYHNTPHEGLAGDTPRNAWLRMTKRHGVQPPPPPFIRRSIFGVQCERRVGGKGVRFLGIHYQSPLLQQIRASKANPSVRIRVNRFDLGEISFWDERHGGWAVARARLDGFQGVTVWEWIASVEHLNRTNADNARLSRSVVVKTINELRAYGEMAVKRAELGSPILNDEFFRKIERSHFAVFEMMDDGEVAEAVRASAAAPMVTWAIAEDDLNPATPDSLPSPGQMLPQGGAIEGDSDTDTDDFYESDDGQNWSIED